MHPAFPVIILLVFIGFPQLLSAQRKSDIGIIGGASYYMGDVNHARHFYSPGPAGGFIFRYNFNPRNSIRLNAAYAQLKGDPSKFEQPFAASAAPAFSSSVIDIGLATEFNFMTYKATKVRKERYTPYVSGGIGYSVMLGGGYTPTLNFGGGFKYNVTTRMSAGMEWSFRKTFTDDLEGYDNADFGRNIGYENNVFFHNKDWYSIVGIFITYKIFDWGLDCAAYE